MSANNAASGNFNALGDWDPTEPPFTDDELDEALRLRQHVQPDPGLKRKDQCPHQPLCQDLDSCVRYIAWYRRHQAAIEASLKKTAIAG